jgi:hypothetical protein
MKPSKFVVRHAEVHPASGQHLKSTAAPNHIKTANLRKNRLRSKNSSFATVFASAVGGGTIGSIFGAPGLLLGAALGSGIGLYVERKGHA